MKFKSSRQRRRLIFAISFLSGIVIIFTLTPIIGAAQQKAFVASEITKLRQDDNFTSLVDQVESIASFDEVDLKTYEALANQLSDADPLVFAALIESEDVKPVLQQAFISFAEYNHISLPEDIVQDILLDTNANADVRIEMLFYCSAQGEEYADLIEAALSDEEIGFYAIREYYTKDPEAVISFAENTLQQYDGTYSQQLQGAIWVKVQSLNANSSEKDRQEFIAFCDQLIYEDNADNEIIQNLILNYIGSIDSWESLSYLIDNEDYTELLPLLADANSATICAILAEKPNVQRLDAALRAITYGAEAHFHEALAKNMKENSAFYADHPDLQALAEQAMALVQEEVLWMQQYGSLQ